jgi:hypothetical protein
MRSDRTPWWSTHPTPVVSGDYPRPRPSLSSSDPSTAEKAPTRGDKTHLWKTYDDQTLYSLEISADLLHRYRPEPVFDEEKVPGLIDMVREIIDEVAKEPSCPRPRGPSSSAPASGRAGSTALPHRRLRGR